MTACLVLYEPKPPGYQWSDENWERGTHTCGLDAGHEGDHICPRCGKRWDHPRGDGQ